MIIDICFYIYIYDYIYINTIDHILGKKICMASSVVLKT